MAFCTTQHIIDSKGSDVIAQLTGDPAGATVDTAKVQAQINSFASKMEAAIRVQYPDQPFGDEQLYLRELNVEGAYLQLERNSPRGWTDDHIKRYEMLEKELDKIANGMKKLRSVSESEIKKSTDGFFSSKPRLFHRNSLAPEI